MLRGYGRGGGFRAERGFALVTVLLLASLLMVMLVGLLFMTSEEGERSSMFVEGERNHGLVEVALAEVRAKLMDGGEVPYKDGVARASMTACPGLLEVRRYDVLPNRGYQVGREAFMDENSFFRKPFAREYERSGEGDWQPANPRWIALYSQKWYAPLCQYMSMERDEVRDVNPDYNPERVFNLNTADNPFRPGRLYFGGGRGKNAGVKSVSIGGEYAKKSREKAYRYREGESSVERPLYVQWIPVYKDARYGEVLPNGKGNPIVGRYAYWVDVENTKINVNSVRNEWGQTALGKLTGDSDASRGERKGGYFEQWGEKANDTPRYLAEIYKPKTYGLFQDVVHKNYGVKLFYRPNYGHLTGMKASGEEDDVNASRYGKTVLDDDSGEYHTSFGSVDKDSQKETILDVRSSYTWKTYEERIFGWEQGFPPAIADHSVIDGKSFLTLWPYQQEKGGMKWPRFLPGESNFGYNSSVELFGLLDPLVEKRNKVFGQIEVEGLKKIHDQVFTFYGWDEEKDPLGKPKLDINEILREGDALFDQGLGLPRVDHSGTPLQQFLARTEDPRYYSAYYPGAYPSGGKGRSFVDGLKTFAGRGAHPEKYAKAMRDQMVVNIIEYGRNKEDPPYINRDQGIVGAKSMPYVAEVAIRARNAIWDLWDYAFAPYKPDPNNRDPRFTGFAGQEYKSWFPGFDESELVYADDFQRTKQSALQNKALAQLIADWFFDGFRIEPSASAINLDDYFIDAGLSLSGYISRKDIFGNRGYIYHTLKEVLTHVVIDTAFGLVNPDPFGKENASDWEIEMDYSWFDPNQGNWPSEKIFGGSLLTDSINPAFDNSRGRKRHTLRRTIKNRHYSPYLFPGTNRQVDQLGYFFGVNEPPSATHNVVYFRAKPQRIVDLPDENTDTGIIPGELIDGFASPHALQCFRLRGWRIYRKDKQYSGGRKMYHAVPIRHPGQVSAPREFWQMSVDRDGDGPEPPPNTGVLGSPIVNYRKLGLSKSFRHADFHSLRHFQQPPNSPITHVHLAENGEIAAPFGLGNNVVKGWEGLRQRQDVATSCFSSQTIAEFLNYCESLMATIPPGPGKTQQLLIYDIDKPDPPPSYGEESKETIPFDFTAPDDPRYFYWAEQALVEQYGQPPYIGLEGKLYIPERAFEKVYKKALSKQTASLDARYKVRSDILRFLLLQLKLRDEAFHNRAIARETGRSQKSTGRNSNDDYVSGMALVERLVCGDPVLSHRTGNPDLRVQRGGKTYSGHFYGINGHPWRRYNYYFYHYDKDNNSPQEEVLGSIRRPEPDRCLTWYFNDPRRTDGFSEPEYAEESKKRKWKEWDYSDPSGSVTLKEESEYTYHYTPFFGRETPLHSLTGSVLWNAILTKENSHPDLRGELGWSKVTDIEEDGVRVWPYGVGLNLNFTYGNREENESVHDRLNFRNGSFQTHSPRGRLMTSIGEIGLCHSGFLQRAIDLDRPPLYSAPGVKRLGSPQYGPPMSMLLDLLTPSRFRDVHGDYLSRADWSRGKYPKHSFQNPRKGTWNVNCQIAQDHYLAIREGAHGVLSNESGDFLASNLDSVSVHPVLVPNTVGKKGNREIVDSEVSLDPYLSVLVRFRRGWEHWLGAVGGDYSTYRNMGNGVWDKENLKSSFHRAAVYDIAQGTRSFAEYLGGRKRNSSKRRVGKISPFFSFGNSQEGNANLLVLGRELKANSRGEIDRGGLYGHVSADGPARDKGEGVYPLREKDNISIYDVTRYGLFPLIHHISEIGYTGLGKVYTALNYKNKTTSARGGFAYEEILTDERSGGDGILGAMSQAGFARNAPWVMSANQMSTSANVFTLHIVTQSLRDKGGTRSRKQRAKNKKLKSLVPNLQLPVSSIGYMDKEDEILGEQWAQIVIAKLPRRKKSGAIKKNSEGAPQHDYRVLSKQVLENSQ